MKARVWLAGWTLISLFGMGLIFALVYEVDPFFHYHKPNIEKYYYTLDNQRSQNNGIVKHFEYDALVTGTSMTENFKTTEMDELFGTKSIKVPFSGGEFKEINDNVRVALEKNSRIKVVVRGLDLYRLDEDKDAVRDDLGIYPTYLYDDCPYNDTQYVYNKNILFERVLPMIERKNSEGFSPGIDCFDEYSRWQNNCSFGIKQVISEDFSKVYHEQTYWSRSCLSFQILTIQA